MSGDGTFVSMLVGRNATTLVSVPLGGVPAAQCDGAHAGVPASVGLQTIWKTALEETYDAKVAEAWTKNDCIEGKPSCMHLDKKLHPMYDHNNKPKDDHCDLWFGGQRLVQQLSSRASSSRLSSLLFSEPWLATQSKAEVQAGHEEQHASSAYKLLN